MIEDGDHIAGYHVIDVVIACWTHVRLELSYVYKVCVYSIIKNILQDKEMFFAKTPNRTNSLTTLSLENGHKRIIT